ncbi:MAG: protein-disulfide isomerase-like protein [Alphaproteobacteria bacterium]|nr:protein-disulfide isomerase-like protein [Alphaproteobacteria bacterium]
MKSVFGTGVIAVGLLLAGCGDHKAGSDAATNSGAAPAPIAAPNGGDWTQTITDTPEGGYRMGNPGAPVKLVEYASYTCPHCAEFTEKASVPLHDLVRNGRVSWEFRPYLLFPTDPGISMLVRCHGAEASFLLADQLYATQKDWVAKLQALSPAEAQRINALPPQQQLGEIVKAGGLDQFFRQRGMPEARINACLADQKGLDRAMAITKTGSEEMEVQGTPTFFINGKKVENAASWETLEPELRKALG